MSQFLPEGSSQQPVNGVSSITPSSAETTAEDVALMQRVLAAAARNPNLIPTDFMSYVLDFMQVSNLEIPIGRIFGFRQQTDVRGHVSSLGGITNGVGFTVSKLGTGNYLVTFSDALTAVPAIGVTIDDNSGVFFACKVANASTTVFQVLIYTVTTGVLTDAGFYFTASPFV